MSADTLVALVALVVSIVSLGLSAYVWRRSFRPIVTAMVKTHSAGTDGISFDLVLLNSGSIPAKNIRIRPVREQAIAAVLGMGAFDESRRTELACFDEATVIPILHNGATVSCSFGQTRRNDRGFWRYGAEIPVRITYEGWFGTAYEEEQTLQVVDSDSFTGFMWGDRSG